MPQPSLPDPGQAGPEPMLPEFSHWAKEATDKSGLFLLLEAAMLYSIPSQQDLGMITVHFSHCQMDKKLLLL